PSPDPKLSGCPRPCLSIAPPTIVAPRVEFDANSIALTSSGRAVLDQVVQIMQSRPGLIVAVEGHTDVTEPAALADRRAAVVRAYLISKGIAASRLSAQGFGAQAPIAPNTTTDGRARNRRVEFRITP